MLFNHIKTLPALTLIVDDICGSPNEIAKLLHRNTDTVIRWIGNDSAPRSSHLALFLMSRWGRSELSCDAYNERMVNTNLIRALNDECNRLRQKIEDLCQIGDFGSANDPLGVSATPTGLYGLRPPSQQAVSALRVTIPNANSRNLLAARGQ